MPITDLAGWPAPAAASLLVIGVHWLFIAAEAWVAACWFSGYVPTGPATLATWCGPAAAVGPVSGVDVPRAAPPLLLVRWTTRTTRAATPITAAARYRTIRTP